MPGKILIIDQVATHRIVLKVKLANAQYDIQTCTTCDEARGLLASGNHDLVLINLGGSTEGSHGFCRELRNAPNGDSMVIVGTGVEDTSRARFAALDAGADDVLVPHVSDSLLLARIRSLLRRRNVAFEWQMRDGTSRALGFDEARAEYQHPAQITVVAHQGIAGAHLVETLQSGLGHRVMLSNTALGHGPKDSCRNADLFVIDATYSKLPKSALFQLISDIHARSETRRAAKMVILPQGEHNKAAMLLDLGADDVVFSNVESDELLLRARVLISHKIQQDRLRDRVRSGLQAAVTDPLTGLYNRRYAETHLDRIADQAQATGRQYALMVVDIDHFKSVNDTYGHSAGDAVLRTLAERLRANFRAIDLLARIGGEEFLIAMPNTTTDQAHFAAERMRRLVNDTPFYVSGQEKPLNITVSVGIAIDGQCEVAPQTPNHLFERADEALYKAKSSGRNTVSIHMSAA